MEGFANRPIHVVIFGLGFLVLIAASRHIKAITVQHAKRPVCTETLYCNHSIDLLEEYHLSSINLWNMVEQYTVSCQGR